MDRRHLDERYAEIARRLIETEEELKHIKNSNVTIAYLGSEHKKKKANGVVNGQCEKVADKWKWGIPADFTITIFEPNVAKFSETQLEALLFHELLHVGVEVNSDGEEVYSILDHDLQDFRSVLERYGVDWDRVDNEEE